MIGPWFDDAVFATALDRFSHDATADVADEGRRMVRTNLSRVLRHPTGYYESHIEWHRDGGDAVISDDYVIYGPWLEGVGSRNSPVTRFPGYFTFRRTQPQLAAAAEALCAPALARFTDEVG